MLMTPKKTGVSSMAHSTRESRRLNWHTLIENYEKSGLSQKNFCEKNSVTLSQFVYYRNKFKSTKKVSLPSQSLFSPIQLQKSVSNDSRGLWIALPNGFQCTFPSDVDVITLKKYVETLLSC